MKIPRVGTGYDSHRFVAGRKLVLGGVDILHDRGLEGHSDADAVIHSIIDALLGAAALGDIGGHFSDKDPKYAGISSRILLKETASLIRQAGYGISNVDCTVVCEVPRLAPYITSMRGRIANDLGLKITDVSVKAKTNEKMGFAGRGEGIVCYASALIYPLG